MPAMFTNQDAALADLTAKLAKVTAERDRARDLAVALEQEVTHQREQIAYAKGHAWRIARGGAA